MGHYLSVSNIIGSIQRRSSFWGDGVTLGVGSPPVAVGSGDTLSVTVGSGVSLPVTLGLGDVLSVMPGLGPSAILHDVNVSMADHYQQYRSYFVYD